MKNANSSLPRLLASRSRISAIALAALLCVAAARADVIVLRNGNEIQGEILEQNENRLVVRFPGGVLQLKRRDVAEVRSQERKEYLLNLGEKQILRHSYSDAVKTLSKAVRENPKSEALERKLGEARLKLAGDLAKRRRYDDALDIYLDLERERPQDEEIKSEIDFIEDKREEGLREERRGRDEIEGGDLDTGVWRLERVFDAFPDRRDALKDVLAGGLILQAESFRRRSRFEDAAERLDAALAIAPTAVEEVRDAYVQCKVELIPALVGQDRYDEVHKLAQQGLEVAPSDPALNFFRALADHAAGKTERAAERYAAIIGERAPRKPRRVIDDLRRRAEDHVAEKQQAVYRLRQGAVQEVLPGDFREIRTTHFEVLHRNSKIGREVSFVAERAYSDLFRGLGCTTHWRTRCTIHVFPSKEEYLATVKLGEWSGAAHRLDSRRGALSEHKIYTYQGQPRLADGLLRHEIAHALLMHRLNYPRDIPLWANEGFAVFVEPSFMHQRYDRICLEAITKKSLIPVHELLKKNSYPDGRVDLFYGQSFSLVRYLIAKKGVARFVDFLRDITTSGLTERDALKKHYRITSELALENRWRSSMKAKR